MRVLHVYRTYFPGEPGGLQEAIRQIALSTSAFGVQSRIFTLARNPRPQHLKRPEGEVFRCKSWAAPASCDIGDLGALRRFRQLTAWADLVHYYFPWPFMDILRLAAGHDKPAIMTYVSDIVRQRALAWLYQPLMWRTLRGMDAVVTVAPRYAETSPVLQRLDKDKLRQIPLGIAEESVREAVALSLQSDIVDKVQHEIARRSINVAEGRPAPTPFFLSLGVLRYYKGLDFLIRASALSGLPTVIAGDGPQRRRLERFACRIGAPVLFLGRVTDAEKLALLRECTALVMPSHLRSEAFGMALVEASMMSKAMISCEIGTGTSYVNQHQQTGLVVPPEDSDALADAMQVLNAEVALRDYFGANARARYLSLFSGVALGKAYSQLYASVVDDRRPMTI